MNGSRAGSHGLTKTEIILILVVVAGVAAAIVAVVLNDPTGKSGSGLGEESIYDLKALRAVDPALIHYEESGPIETDFSTVRAMAVGPNPSGTPAPAGGPSEAIYVAGDQAIKVFDTAGSLLREVAVEGEATCISVAAEGLIYLGQRERVDVYRPDGTRTARWDITEGEPVVTAVAAAKDGVFVANAGKPKPAVLLYKPDGTLVRRLGLKDADRNIPGLFVPSPYLDVALGSDGLVRIVNPGRHLIEVYTPAGDLEFSWGEAGSQIDRFLGCCNPTHVALTAEGGVITTEKGLLRIKTFDAQGAFQGVVAIPDDFGKDAEILDVAVDSQERVLVLDSTRRAVRIFTKKANT